MRPAPPGPARPRPRFAAAAPLALLLAACGAADGAPTDGPAADASDVLGVSRRGDPVFEIRKPVPGDGAPFASFNYLCSTCGTADEAAFAAVELPEGFERAPSREVLAARIELRALPDAASEPRALDVLPAVEGAEFALGARPLGGRLEGGWAFLELASDRTLAWDAGDVVATISDGTATYAAFLGLAGTTAADLAATTPPAGFTFAERTLDAPLVVDAGGHPEVILGLAAPHLWQRLP